MRTPPKEPFFNTHKIVAMKRVVDPDVGSYAEVEMLKKLDHPAIVKYLTSFNNESNDLCIIMEYCQIGDLEDLIKTQIPGGPQIATEINIIIMISNIASALEYIHQKGIIHRDIKPKNILCGVKNMGFEIKLADFGLAKLMELRTQSGRQVALTHCGTHIYMSPEALRTQTLPRESRQPYGAATDIFSFGATISFVCNEGRHLFTSKDAVLQWTGGNSTINETKYSIYLRKLMTAMLCPQAENRPKANYIWEKCRSLVAILKL